MTDLSNDWAMTQWLGPASPMQLELWRAENHWASLCPSVPLPPVPEKDASTETHPQ
jgi:hypothetical protein